MSSTTFFNFKSLTCWSVVINQRRWCLLCLLRLFLDLRLGIRDASRPDKFQSDLLQLNFLDIQEIMRLFTGLIALLPVVAAAEDLSRPTVDLSYARYQGTHNSTLNLNIFRG